MNKERYQRVRDLFHSVCELPEPERSTRLADACGDDGALLAEVEALLRYHREEDDDDSFGESKLGIGMELIAESVGEGDHVEDTPRKIGPYTIVRKIGEGGMGSVFEAIQDKPRRKVALKIVRPGLTSREVMRRFEREADVLGHLQHPGIAQIYEAGTAKVTMDSGLVIEQSFLAMELIDGVTLTDHTRQQDLNTHDRLTLFAKICDAVQHAHQKGIIHRDLKPGNILVTPQGEPKTLDFGIARLTDADMAMVTMQTDVGQLIGTLAYMSPEQVLGDSRLLDTRSDVYALGVILYELLTGRLPHDVRNCSVPEATRMIREDDPQPISTLNSTLRGDVATITTKALEKDKECRYSSAAELAADVRRFLVDEPIIARPATTTYLLRKFAKRNKGLVAALCSIAAALVLGLGLASYGFVSASRERDRALDAEAQSEAVTSFLSKTLSSVDPSEQGRDVTVRQILDASAGSIGEEFSDQPLVEARLRHTIGRTYLGLGVFDAASEQLERAKDIRLQRLGLEHTDTLATLTELAEVYRIQERYEQSMELFDRALLASQNVLGADHKATLDLLLTRTQVLEDFDRIDEAEGQIRLVLDRRLVALGPHHADTALTKRRLGGLLLRRGKYEEAEPLLRAALEYFRANKGRTHPETCESLNAVAGLEEALGRFREAESLFRELVEINREVFGEEHPTYGQSLRSLASNLWESGNYSESEALFREVLAIYENVYGPDHMEVANTLRYLATTLSKDERAEEAEKMSRRALEIYRTKSGLKSADTAMALNDLAQLLLRLEQFDEAESLAREAIEVNVSIHGDVHPDTIMMRENLGGVFVKRGQPEKAAPIVQKVLKDRRALLGDDHPAVSRTLFNLGVVRSNSKDFDGAAEAFADALDRFRKELGPEHPNVVLALGSLAGVYQDRGDYDIAAETFSEALALSRKVFGEKDKRTLRAINNLAFVYVKQKRFQDADPLVREFLQGAEATLPEDDYYHAIFATTQGMYLTGLRRYEEAEPILLTAYGKLSLKFGPTSEIAATTARALVDLYEAMERPEQRETWKQRASAAAKSENSSSSFKPRPSPNLATDQPSHGLPPGSPVCVYYDTISRPKFRH